MILVSNAFILSKSLQNCLWLILAMHIIQPVNLEAELCSLGCCLYNQLAVGISNGWWRISQRQGMGKELWTLVQGLFPLQCGVFPDPVCCFSWRLCLSTAVWLVLGRASTRYRFPICAVAKERAWVHRGTSRPQNWVKELKLHECDLCQGPIWSLCFT